MELKNMSPNHEQVLNCLTCLFQKILVNHTKENIIEFVLHTLCQEECLNLSKAAYFVDNHDFDCLKGVAGFDKTNEYHSDLIWKDTDNFTNHMKNCSFNQKVRNIMQPSGRQRSEKEIITSIADELSINNHSYLCWDVKHDNKALLIFEPLTTSSNQELLQGLYLLGFCPVF